MRSSTKIMTIKDARKRLKEIAKAIQKFGWRRVVIGRVDENLERKRSSQLVYKRKKLGF
jgi:hypothetical protein